MSVAPKLSQVQVHDAVLNDDVQDIFKPYMSVKEIHVHDDHMHDDPVATSRA